MTIHREMYKEDEEKRSTVIVSGGFDPVHAGHIRMIRDAANFGDVIVIANSDDFSIGKGGVAGLDYYMGYINQISVNKILTLLISTSKFSFVLLI